MIDDLITRGPPISATSSPRLGKGMTTLGTAAAFGALLAAASCCVLPLALAALGIGAGLSSTFVALMPLRWPLTIMSALSLAGGWWVYTKRRGADLTCATPLPSRSTPVILTIGTILTLIAVLWDHFEAPLMNLLA